MTARCCLPPRFWARKTFVDDHRRGHVKRRHFLDGDLGVRKGFTQQVFDFAAASGIVWVLRSLGMSLAKM